MRLIHYSLSELGDLVSKTQKDPVEIYGKPKGLWVSAEGEDDWPHWCEGEGFAMDRFQVATEVVLKPEARVLVISTVEELDAFHEKYALDTELTHLSPRSRSIDWKAVADAYQGLIIAPYQWERRLSDICTWYYTWDCASGCIWDVDAIAELRPAEVPEFAKEAA